MRGHEYHSSDHFFKDRRPSDSLYYKSVDEWMAYVYEMVDFPDERLATRFKRIMNEVIHKPADSIPQAFSNWKDIKGTYRFIENERVERDAIVEAMRKATAKHSEGHATMLAIQDTTELSFPTAHQTTGLGYVNDTDCPGMFMHSTLAVGHDGITKGLFDVQIWSRPYEQRGKKKTRYRRPIEDKESYKWIHGIKAAHEALQTLPSDKRPYLIHVGDREEDVHEVFQQVLDQREGAVIRSIQNRSACTQDGKMGYAHQLVRERDVLVTHNMEVPRKSGQKARTATVELRACPLLITPRSPNDRHRTTLELTLVEVWEPHPPEGTKSLHWLLWTTERVSTKHQALHCVEIYKTRWKIEEFHLVLKSGCKVEDLRMDTADRISKTVCLYAMVAVRILSLRDISRTEPEAPCTVVLEEAEWRALWSKINGQVPPVNLPPPTIKQAILWIGKLGGHIGRKRDGMPGVRTLWRGLRDLEILTSMFVLFYY